MLDAGKLVGVFFILTVTATLLFLFPTSLFLYRSLLFLTSSSHFLSPCSILTTFNVLISFIIGCFIPGLIVSVSGTHRFIPNLIVPNLIILFFYWSLFDINNIPYTDSFCYRLFRSRTDYSMLTYYSRLNYFIPDSIDLVNKIYYSYLVILSQLFLTWLFLFPTQLFHSQPYCSC